MGTRRRRTVRRRTRRRRTSRRRVVRRRRKARKVSNRGSKSQVFRGTKTKTKSSGQTKNDLMKNKRGKIVSKKLHAKGKRVYKKNGLAKWTNAFMQAKRNQILQGSNENLQKIKSREKKNIK